MTQVAPRTISLKNHTKKVPYMGRVRQVIRPEKRVLPRKKNARETRQMLP